MRIELFRNLRKSYKLAREKPQFWFFREQGFGYIQIPKVASRSIRAALLDANGLCLPEEDFRHFEERCSAHLKQPKIRQAANGLFVFAFVRNPYSRIYSAYRNKVVDAAAKGGENIFACHGIEFGMSFEAFVERVCALRDTELDRHLRSQAWFLSDDQGLIPDFVGKLEQFSSDWALLRQKLPQLEAVGHKNSTDSTAEPGKGFHPRIKRLIVDRYQKDFSLFGYDEEL